MEKLKCNFLKTLDLRRQPLKLRWGGDSHIERKSSYEEAVSTLTRLGLSSVQARVYLTLANFGVSTPRTISKASGVARQDTYRIMSVLQELGLVEKLVTSPSMFRAIPMHDALPMLVQRRIDETSELQTKTQEIIKNFDKARTPLEDTDLDFISTRAKELIVMKARSIEKGIDCINSWDQYVKYARAYLGSVDRASKEEVGVRLITNKPKDEGSLPKIVKDHFKRRKIEVRYIPYPPRAALMICDKKEVFIALNEKASSEENPALWSRNRCLITLAQDYFDIMWHLIGIPTKKHFSSDT